jgi:hypothetical protein
MSSSANSTMIRLPIQVHHQLKALALVRRMSMVEVIEGVLREAVAKGEILDIERAYTVLREANGLITIIASEETIRALSTRSPQVARDLAKAITRVLDRPVQRNVYVGSELATLYRRARGGVVLDYRKKRWPMSTQIARGVAGDLEKAAKAAEGAE